MPALGFNDIANLGKEIVAERSRYMGENETPIYNHFNSRPKKKLDEQGYRMPFQAVRPGGHQFYAQGASDFRDPITMKTDSMRVYPTWYSLAHTLEGATLRGLKEGRETQLLDFRRNLNIVTDAAKKRINQILHGDGTAAVAVLGAGTTSVSTSITCLTLASSAAGEAETKGAVRLELGHTYAIINASTNAIKQIFTVTTESRTAPNVTIDVHTANGVSGDPIVDLSYSNSVSSYKKAPAGLRSLCAQTGILQGINRADYLNLRTPRVNGNDLPITPYVLDSAKTLVRVAANDMGEAMGKLIVMTPGQDSILRAQQFGYRRYNGNETVKGVAGKYVDADGDTVIYDADGAEDRVYVLDGNSFYLGEEKPFGLYTEDGLELRMLQGVNGIGSDSFSMAVGWGGNLIKDVSESYTQKDAYIDRLSQTDVIQQTSL